ncbi:hypothetical protein MAPG_09629 [Magnaporthiopsis poae ATCC 64411]|uniref:Uncharacterized protein n=1 Tax=Magnaporthiopsis poae (strain ATCC 64411 / 73-15) TaxID=644358 RepID=A0A0C4EAF9_MAGP6|nr:hypothetical protein MAPG_09629 [Magnaporthiopsis poae ATCC 64411]
MVEPPSVAQILLSVRKQSSNPPPTIELPAARTMPPPTYIISKVADPIFAVFIGVSAAATRIRREEKEKGKTTADTMEALRR